MAQPSIEAYNVKLKKKENMKNPELVKCDNGRWRAAGKGSDGTGMTKFLSDSEADKLKKAGVPVRK